MKRKIDIPAELRRALNLYLAATKLRSAIQQAYVKTGATHENDKLFDGALEDMRKVEDALKKIKSSLRKLEGLDSGESRSI